MESNESSIRLAINSHKINCVLARLYSATMYHATRKTCPFRLNLIETKTALTCSRSENPTQYKLKKYVFQTVDPEKIISGVQVYY